VIENVRTFLRISPFSKTKKHYFLLFELLHTQSNTGPQHHQ